MVTFVTPVLDTGLQVPPGNVHRIGNRPLLELVRLTDVEEQVAAGQQGLGPGRIGFGDARTGIGQKVSECCHTGKATKQVGIQPPSAAARPTMRGSTSLCLFYTSDAADDSSRVHLSRPTISR